VGQSEGVRRAPRCRAVAAVRRDGGQSAGVGFNGRSAGVVPAAAYPIAGDARFRSSNALSISVENGQSLPKKFSVLANPAPCGAPKTCLSNRVAVARTTKVVFAEMQLTPKGCPPELRLCTAIVEIGDRLR